MGWFNKKKQFKIDNSLIPDEGRDLQCGSCNHIWFYNIQEKNNKVLELKQEIISEDIETKVDNKEDKIEEEQQPEEIINGLGNNFQNEKLNINIKDYYFSNVVARSSKTMLDCHNSKLKIKGTGTDG